MSYIVEFATLVRSHFDHLTASQRAQVIATIDQQLIHDPLIETRNRKKLRPNPLAPWELRIGDLRVFYDVDEPVLDFGDDDRAKSQATSAGVVTIIAVGQKTGNILRIGGKRIKL